MLIASENISWVSLLQIKTIYCLTNNFFFINILDYVQIFKIVMKVSFLIQSIQNSLILLRYTLIPISWQRWQTVGNTVSILHALVYTCRIYDYLDLLEVLESLNILVSSQFGIR